MTDQSTQSQVMGNDSRSEKLRRKIDEEYAWINRGLWLACLCTVKAFGLMKGGKFSDQRSECQTVRLSRRILLSGISVKWRLQSMLCLLPEPEFSTTLTQESAISK